VKAIQCKARNMGLRSGVVGNQFTSPRFDSRMSEKNKKGEDENLEELWSSIYEFQRQSLKLSSRVDEDSAIIDVGHPIGVAFLADAHIGSISCRYEELVDRINLIAETPGLYVFSVGDTIDNHLPTKHAGGVFGELFPPELQKELVERLFSKLKGRWLGVVQGCHEEFSHEADDFDWTKYLAKKLGCPNFGFGGVLNLVVGNEEYRIMARHKYRFNSSFNLTATVKRMREQLGDFDIGIVSHHHQAAIEQVIQGDGVDRIFIRPGSFKPSDRYSRSLGYPSLGAFIPTVILFPHERRMIPFLHLEQSAVVLKALNEG